MLPRAFDQLNRPSGPIVIAHRGASGYRPEHTLAAYELAIEQGADFIEPDLVSTADGVLVARHEGNLIATTDVADHPRFADRYCTKVIDDHESTGWFVEDFSYAELNELRAVERLPDLRPANCSFNGQSTIPRFEEILALAAARSNRERTIGVYPETKHPSYFRSLGLPLEPGLLRCLDEAGLNNRSAPIFIQSAEIQNLTDLRSLTEVPLIQLIKPAGGPADSPATTYEQMLSRSWIETIAAYADGIGPAKSTVTVEVIDHAHEVGLLVHPWTFRRENCFLDAPYRSSADPNAAGDLGAEIRHYLDIGIDGLFCDFPDIANSAVHQSSMTQQAG